MHKVDQLGYPIDPELKRLEFHLGHLVNLWVNAYGNPERQGEIVREYRSTLERDQKLFLGIQSIKKH